MEVLVERCAGLDVGKADLKACVRVAGPRGGRRQQIKTFATTTRALLELRQWLTAEVASLARGIATAEGRIVAAVQLGATLADARGTRLPRFAKHLRSVDVQGNNLVISTNDVAATAFDARGHSSATVYEAAQAETRLRAAARAAQDFIEDADIAVDPAICAAWPGAKRSGPAFTAQGAGGDNLALHHAVGL
jgi:hypothetical protein